MESLTPSQKGAVAEAAITAAALQLSLVVLRPLAEGGRYDLMFDLEPELLRVQCKLARHRDSVLSVRLQTSRCTPSGYVRTSYTADEVDMIATYSPELHRSFLIPIDEAHERRSIHLRLEPALNNQMQGVKWARDYDFATMIQRLRTHPIDGRPPTGAATLLH
jgi:PD-(D/E)XK endonuclease